MVVVVVVVVVYMIFIEQPQRIRTMVSPWLLTKMKYLLGLNPGARDEPLPPSRDNLVMKMKYLLSDEPPPFRSMVGGPEEGGPQVEGPTGVEEAPMGERPGPGLEPEPGTEPGVEPESEAVLPPPPVNTDCDDPNNRDILATIFTEENGRVAKQCITRQDFVSARG